MNFEWLLEESQANKNESVTPRAAISVRHPLRRLVSAYRDKYLGGLPIDAYNDTYRKKKYLIESWYVRWYNYWLPVLISSGRVSSEHLYATYNNHSSRFDFMHELIITAYGGYDEILVKNFQKATFSFEQFINHVLWTHELKLPDFHWISVFKTCHPCFYHYDYVIHLETVKEDVRDLLSLTHIQDPDKYPFPTRHVTKEGTSSDASYFANIPSHVMQMIFQIYALDFKLFGYSTYV
ncbi:hypothetical protein Pmani_006606 [Petrolisthes manimaculis]|uniref:Carbohydrate sulfotransferase n=1 Tax=Petrolisthes manimaculis TaxID=1843537 RepID=A0AAE1Q995_9EUCA|nr:hypothetical protein Pmani_006606 [Petrolisthes manimaculis]